jgi:hypothetical protein
LRYAGVAPASRNNGVFSALVARVQSRLVPVTAAVPARNRGDAIRRLEHLGFQSIGDSRLRWEPSIGNR